MNEEQFVFLIERLDHLHKMIDGIAATLVVVSANLASGGMTPAEVQGLIAQLKAQAAKLEAIRSIVPKQSPVVAMKV